MIMTLEKAARTEEEAISAALEELGLERDDVSVEILERAKSGFLGIGAAPAKIRVSYSVPDEKPLEKDNPSRSSRRSKNRQSRDKAEGGVREAKKVSQKAQAPISEKAPVKEDTAPVDADESKEYAEIRGFLNGLLERMGTKADIEISPRENGGINVRLSGDGMGSVIGRRGETLDAIQHLTNYVVNHGSDKRMHINIDAEEYRAKREDSLVRLAEKMAEKAIKYKRNMALEPMNSYERHVIHTALQDYKGVTTASTGEEPNRRVVVIYEKDGSQPKDSKPKIKEWA